MLVMLSLFLAGCSKNLSETAPSPQVLNGKTERYLSDYDYMVDTIVNNYPYFDIARIMTDKDFETIQTGYRQQAANIETDIEFFSEIIRPFLAEFNYIGHMSIVSKEEYDTQFNLLKNLLNTESLPKYGSYILEKYSLPNVRNFYETSFAQTVNKIGRAHV